MDSDLNGGILGNHGYQQALTRQGVPFSHQGQNFGYPMLSGPADFHPSQTILPSSQTFERRPEVGHFIPSEESRFRQMNLRPPAVLQSRQMPTDPQINFAQTLWRQGGRDGKPTPTAQFDNLPPSDFIHGYPPVFSQLTNPERQDLFQQPTSLHGRRDLPPSYVYPFADSGSIMQPGVPSGELYSLGEPSQETLSEAAKMLAMANPGAVHPQRNVPLTPELQEALEKTAWNNHAERVGQDKSVSADRLATDRTAPTYVQERSGSQGVFSTPSAVVEQSDFISAEDGKAELCPQCINSDLEKMVGSWTQLYGNANILKVLYATLSSVKQPSGGGEAEKLENVAPVFPTCVGIQVSRPRSHQSEIEILFHSGESFVGEPQKLQGVILQDRNVSAHGKALEVRLPNFKLPLCLVKAGSSRSAMYSYMIWTEAKGANRCRSHHVFARHVDIFHRDHIDEVGKYLKQEYEKKRLLIMSALEHPLRCLP